MNHGYIMFYSHPQATATLTSPPRCSAGPRPSEADAGDGWPRAYVPAPRPGETPWVTGEHRGEWVTLMQLRLAKHVKTPLVFVCKVNILGEFEEFNNMHSAELVILGKFALIH